MIRDSRGIGVETEINEKHRIQRKKQNRDTGGWNRTNRLRSSITRSGGRQLQPGKASEVSNIARLGGRGSLRLRRLRARKRFFINTGLDL